MTTVPEYPGTPRPSTSHYASRRGFRVPFGLRDGRVWAPTEVESGKACGCVCPACQRPLVAKAKVSRHYRPFFAHMVDLGCATGTETGIHLRAKQVIAERRQLLLPAWGGDLLDKPNPPTARDALRRIHEGVRVDLPAHMSELTEVRQEFPMEGFVPDVYAEDADGVLLIEIRVAHAVDDAKTERVRLGGFRMVEIDLSRMDRDVPHDAPAFDRLVLEEVSNRAWISCPSADREWLASKTELLARIDAINEEIAREEERRAREAARQLEEARMQAADKAGRKEFMRRKLRKPHLDALAALPSLVDRERLAQLEADLARLGGERIEELRQGLPPALDRACMTPQKQDWIYGVAAPIWRLHVLRHFALNMQPGYRFNNRDVFQWIKRSFPIDTVLYGLFMAQYSSRRGAREAGVRKRAITCWAFTADENALIPNFCEPANGFMERLAYLGVLRPILGEIGGYQVAAPPAHGMLPVAAVADEASSDAR